jgi:hypothetical protein
MLEEALEAKRQAGECVVFRGRQRERSKRDESHDDTCPISCSRRAQEGAPPLRLGRCRDLNWVLMVDRDSARALAARPGAVAALRDVLLGDRASLCALASLLSSALSLGVPNRRAPAPLAQRA